MIQSSIPTKWLFPSSLFLFLSFISRERIIKSLKEVHLNFWCVKAFKKSISSCPTKDKTGSKAQIGSNKKNQQTSWKFHLILPLLGSLNLSVSNAYGLTVSLYWITIVTSLASIVKMWYYARWIFRPMEQEMDFVTRLVAFIMLFTYVILSLFIAIIMDTWVSSVATGLGNISTWRFLI